MPSLSTDLRNKLEKAVVAARNLSEKAAKGALEALAVQHHEPYGHMTLEQRALRNQLRAHARQLGDKQDGRGHLSIKHLIHECAYEHWHRMLFARFLAENNLLIEPDTGVAISLDECKELAKEAKTDIWTLAGRYAQKMLPQIFRADDPLLQVTVAKEDQLKLEQLLNNLPSAAYTSSDALGWCYQFWQTERKKQVNESGVKIGADELPAVTQLFTEDYMVDFLLDNTLGAWWAGKALAVNPKLAETAKSEENIRKAVSLPGVPWSYLRFIKGDDGKWRPAAGAFDGWPKLAMELKCLDPCMGSGHFVVAMFERLVAMRISEEQLSERTAVAAVINDNLFGLEIDQRCTQIAAFNLALAAWRRIGHCALPPMHLACAGLGIAAKKEEWLALAPKSERMQTGMERLYHLFQKAPVLGSLINPRLLARDLLIAEFHELQPLMEQALKLETTDEQHELAVTAKGVAEAAEILSGQFTLVATNVPYLGRGKQDDALKEYCERFHHRAKSDLATCFVERCLDFCAKGGSTALVTPQYWLFQGSYTELRKKFLTKFRFNSLGTLGPRCFETISGEVVNAVLVSISKTQPLPNSKFTGIDVSRDPSPAVKAEKLMYANAEDLTQLEQLGNPDSRISASRPSTLPTLSNYADVFVGFQNGDTPHWVTAFWEHCVLGQAWDAFHATPEKAGDFEGLDAVLRWEGGKGELARSEQVYIKGREAWGRRGVLCRQTQPWPTSLYIGSLYDQSSSVLVPKSQDLLAPLLCFLRSDVFRAGMLSIANTMKFTNSTFVKVPFDLAHWQKVAEEKYPHGVPKPFSSDPTQWLFNGHPKGSDDPLHVSVARLLDYRWPRQTGSSFPDCPALEPDGLEKMADDDGIVCIPSIRGEEPAASRLRKLLAAAYGKDWKPAMELELIRATGSQASDLEEWLLNDFFEQHCQLFHQRPFIWHIWDGRKRDGFHALVNYHKLAADKGKGRRTLESLTHSYLNDWITRQKDSMRRGEEGAEERLASALELKKRLEAIIEGEPPFDIFIRWKPLHQQPIGWEPDINDGVRLNIRPFLASDLPKGKKGAGVLRAKPKIKWEKDRGKEPGRPKDEFPWFWVWDEAIEDFMGGKEFDGNRWNNCHYKNGIKRKARGEKA